MSTEKTEEASSHRLKEARKKGQIPVSAEVNTAVGFVAVVAYLLLQMGDIARQLHGMFDLVLRHVETVGRESAPGTGDVLVEVGISLARLCAPPILIAAGAGFIAGVAQTRGLVSFTPVQFQLERLDPIKGVTNVFSVRNLLTFFKLLAGLAVIGIVVAVMFRDMLPDMIRAGYLPAGRTVTISWYFVSRLIAAGALVAALMAAADYFIQTYSFARNMRMSKQEVTDEYKNLEGNPQVKSQRKQFFEELIDESTQEKIEESQVVVVNPTHVAIVIRYQPGKVDLPLVAVKGLDDVALAIRTYAEKMGIPVYENRVLARDLYRDCRVNEFITHQYFEAVAEVFKWLAKLKGAKQMAQKVLVGKEVRK
jgi:flagellar biosynthesis protein FlhB